MLMASFYDLLLLLHIVFVISTHILISYIYPSFAPLCRILLLEYTMIEFNHPTTAEYLVNFQFLAITVLL